MVDSRFHLVKLRGNITVCSYLFDIFLGPSYNQLPPSVKYMTVSVFLWSACLTLIESDQRREIPI